MNALRTGLVRYDRRHGWRGAKISNIDIAGDWKQRKLASDPDNQSGIDTWRMAVVLGYRRTRTSRIGLADGTHRHHSL